MTLSVQWSRVDDLILDGLEDLASAHWTEAEMDHEAVPLVLDFARARSFEKSGYFRIAAARVQGELVGYAAFTIMTPMFHASTLFAFCDGIYVDPDYRGLNGIRLIRWCEKALKELGVAKVDIESRPDVRLGAKEKSGSLADLLALMGYRLSGTRMTKLL